MTIRNACSGCGMVYTIRDDQRGKKLRCKRCKEVIVVPPPEAPEEPTEKKVPQLRQALQSKPGQAMPPRSQPAAEALPRREKSPASIAKRKKSPLVWVLAALGGVAFVLVLFVCGLLGMLLLRSKPNNQQAENQTQSKADPPPVVKKDEPPPKIKNVAQKSYDYLDISTQANTGRTQGIIFPDNHLGELPVGVQNFAAVPFKIQDRYMLFDENTSAFKNIGVGGKFARLHVIHGAHFYGGEGELLANFTIHYADGTTGALPVCYRRDVVNYWSTDGVPTNATVAWRGNNKAAAAQRSSLSLFLSTYDNPHPEKTVQTIDYKRANQGQVTTFCVAMTVERE